MMAERNGSDGHQKLRIRNYDQYLVMLRISLAWVLPRPCTEINLLQGNVISSISKVPNENKDADALDLCKDSAVSKSFILVDVVDNSCNHIEIKADVCHKIDSSQENVISGTSNIDSEKNCSRLVGTGRSRVAEVIVSDAGDVLLKILVPTSETGANSVCNEKTCNDDEDKVTSEGTQSETNHKNYGDDNYVDSFVLSQSGSIDYNILSESQESRVLGLEKCTELKRGAGCANVSGGIDLIKACSCSFCTKGINPSISLILPVASSILGHEASDCILYFLYYLFMKSKKEASILAARSRWSKATEKHGLGNFSEVSKLESDLMHQWRYLFQHMVDTCEHESNQLETNLLPLTELREQCKIDLEHINATSSEKH
ncbi:unnamed protein product [Fraxinus pennsylvanica]|uniref:Uncharacterized protein n=1 Tax=Fraxinus pennsylvanica TaxID=56036 RepID=A0AAD2A9H4_9LAMI|nr:unnamed protein product [Fraxinus pennsylvanica]